ncbi:hypothetical protein, partial [Burkholderia multivorans]|uniref:hypothetical protein n=1 Tax=Burkholderia multivorans TaxID=87883 RepID=UPI001C61321B
FTQIDSFGLPCNYSTCLEHGNPDTPARDRFLQAGIQEETECPGAPFEERPAVQHVKEKCVSRGEDERPDCAANQNARPSTAKARSKRSHEDAVFCKFRCCLNYGSKFH